jgi:hypothetical protein
MHIQAPLISAFVLLSRLLLAGASAQSASVPIIDHSAELLAPLPTAPRSIPPSLYALPVPPDSGVTNAVRQRHRDEWLALAIVQHGAAGFDAWSTHRVVESMKGQEGNPLLRPFAGNASIYVAVQVAPLVFDLVGHRTMTSRRQWVRRVWWLPQAAGSALSVGSGIHNIHIYNSR